MCCNKTVIGLVLLELFPTPCRLEPDNNPGRILGHRKFRDDIDGRILQIQKTNRPPWGLQL